MAERPKKNSIGINLKWREERFIEEYVRNSGNGTQAAISAGYSSAGAAVQANRLLRNAKVIAAIELARERFRSEAKLERLEILRILIGMATARVSDFAKVLENPSDCESYVGLGPKEYALESVKNSPRGGFEIKLINANERRAILESIWMKSGFGQEEKGQNWLDGLDELLALTKRNSTTGSS